MPTLKENLIKARKLIELPENWTQGYFVKYKKSSLAVPPRDEWKNHINDFCFCTLGAINFLRDHLEEISTDESGRVNEIKIKRICS